MTPRAANRADGSARNRTARAVDCIRRLVNVLGESARAVEQGSGVTNAQLFVLRQLERERELTINELAARALTQQSTVSLLARRLEDAGLVTRTRSADDGRRVCVTLTPKGRSVARRAPEPPIARMLRGLDTMRPAEMDALIRGIGALLSVMRVPADASNAPLFEPEAARRLRAGKASSTRRPRGSRR